MFDRVYVGVHPDHPDGRYNYDVIYARNRKGLINMVPQIFFLEKDAVEFIIKK